MRLIEGADIYQVAKNCRTSVEMIEKFYAAHIKNTLDAAAINCASANGPNRSSPSKRQHLLMPNVGAPFAEGRLGPSVAPSAAERSWSAPFDDGGRISGVKTEPGRGSSGMKITATPCCIKSCISCWLMPKSDVRETPMPVWRNW
jgi:hypothetical protein